MTRPEQRAREIFQAECFRQRSGLDFEIHDDVDGDFPDLRVRHDGRDIGLEITEIFMHTNPGAAGFKGSLAETKAREQVLSEGLRLFSDSDSRMIRLSAIFESASSAPMAGTENAPNRAGLNARLCKFVQSIADNLSLMDCQRFDTVEIDSLWPITTIFAELVPDRSFAGWRLAEPAWTRPIGRRDLTKRIEAKNNRLAEHRSDFHEWWLLLYGDAARPAARFRPPEGKLGLDRSDFDETFVLVEPGFYIDANDSEDGDSG